MNKFILPYNGKVKLTSPFGPRILNGVHEYHSGIDLVGLESNCILSPCDGVVQSSTIILDKSNRTWEWGNYIRIDCDNISVFLCHLSERLVNIGQKVWQGQPIGFEGCTGYCFGDHLHLEFRTNNHSFDPSELLGIDNKVGEYKNGSSELGHDWSRKAIEWAIKTGILKGYNPDKPDYKLEENITREEAIVLLYRLNDNN